jgi:hypothetical protein
MMNSVVSIVELKKLDRYIRKIINENIGGPALSTDMFYSSWKYGGFWLKCLAERYLACKLNALAHFYQRDNGTRRIIEWQMHREKKIRKIETIKRVQIHGSLIGI